MSRSFRAAAVAVVSIAALGVAAAGTPGLAIELDPAVRDTLNAVSTQPVPTPPTPIVPSSWTPEITDTPAIVAPAEEAASEAEAQAAYASLADAVAAQPIPAQMDDELRCLAIGVYYEAKGESLAGQLAVADVILNRAESGRFPASTCGVLKQPGQFSFVRGGRLPSVDTGRAAWREAVAVAQVAIKDHWKSSAPGALFFHARRVSPGWRMTRVASIGNHVFYR